MIRLQTDLGFRNNEQQIKEVSKTNYKYFTFQNVLLIFLWVYICNDSTCNVSLQVHGIG